MKLTRSTKLEELAAVVCTAMAESGFRAVLVGGAVVSIWSKNAYQSHDLDFITDAESKRIDEVMDGLGFERSGRHYEHPDTMDDDTRRSVDCPAGHIENIRHGSFPRSSSRASRWTGDRECWTARTTWS